MSVSNPADQAQRARPVTLAEAIYTAAERDYLTRVHPIARLATVGADGTPHVMPLGMYGIDESSGAIVTTGRDLTQTKKWRDIGRSGRAAIVIDDIEPPFRPRGIEVRGRAALRDGDQPSIWVLPERIIAWGLDEVGAPRNARSLGARAQARRVLGGPM
jgi:pyridoxamine 5'-phosphate oxidase family protein